MKKQQRAPYLGLTTIRQANFEFPSLCCFCRHAQVDGECGETYYICEHPLERVQAGESDVEYGQGKDCWGFRPKWALQDCADMVGIWLNGQIADMENVPELAKRRC